jgi:NADH dehydrogenase
MHILVAGGSGFIGRYLCARLVDRGHDVTALSRDPDPDALPADVATATGDVTAYDSVVGHFEGQDAVVNLVALSPLFEPEGGNQRHDEVHRGGTENCVRAAEEHGVDRFVQLSALGADPAGDTHYIRAKGRAEQVVRDADLEWVVFRPSVVFGEGGEFVSFTKRLKGMFAPGLPLYPLPGGGRETRFQPIWVEDIAGMTAEATAGDGHAGETYELGGPEVLTLREVTELVYESEGTSIRVVGLPMGLAGVGLKTLGVLPGFPMGGDQYRSLKFDNTTEANDIGAFDRSPAGLTTLGSYLGLE